jgi:hypothetical protein
MCMGSTWQETVPGSQFGNMCTLHVPCSGMDSPRVSVYVLLLCLLPVQRLAVEVVALLLRGPGFAVHP